MTSKHLKLKFKSELGPTHKLFQTSLEIESQLEGTLSQLEAISESVVNLNSQVTNSVDYLSNRSIQRYQNQPILAQSQVEMVVSALKVDSEKTLKSLLMKVSQCNLLLEQLNRLQTSVKVEKGEITKKEQKYLDATDMLKLSNSKRLQLLQTIYDYYSNLISKIKLKIFTINLNSNLSENLNNLCTVSDIEMSILKMEKESSVDLIRGWVFQYKVIATSLTNI